MNFGFIEMEVDFDKQIDTILRDLATGNPLAESPPVSHLDADEFSAFAENVLPPKARLRAMEHLADCSNCRKFLSTFVSLSDVAESETVHEVKTIVAVPKIPWYRQLFAFPVLSYGMGAMALLLVGMVSYLVLQNSNDTANSVAKNEPVAEKVKGPSGVSSEGEAPISETYPTNSANTAMPAATVAPTSTNSSTVSNSTVSSANAARAAEPKPVATRVTDEDTDRGITSGSTPEKSADNKKDKTAAKEEVATKGGESIQPEYEVAAKPAPRANDDTVQRADNVQNNRATQNQIMTPDGAEARRNAPSAPPAAKKREVTSSEGEGAKTNRDEIKTSSTRTVAGKTFSNVNGAWTDSAYKGGSATNVRRGTDEYKKLDSGLRSTADYLGGTVVIVWKGKNYKIQ